MCIFCKIANKELEALIIHESENTLAFLDIRPLSMGHTLIIPKKHYKSVLDMPTELAEELLNTTKIVCKKLSRLKTDGFNIVTNINEAAGQEIMHAHIHVIPRYSKEKSRPIKFGKPIECNLEDVYKILKNF